MLMKEFKRIEKKLKEKRAYYKRKKYDYVLKSSKLKKLNKFLMEENRMLSEDNNTLEKEIQFHIKEKNDLKKNQEEKNVEKHNDNTMNVILHLVFSTIINFVFMKCLSETQRMTNTESVGYTIVFLQMCYISGYLYLKN